MFTFRCLNVKCCKNIYRFSIYNVKKPCICIFLLIFKHYFTITMPNVNEKGCFLTVSKKPKYIFSHLYRFRLYILCICLIFR